MNIVHALNPFNPHDKKVYFADEKMSVDDFLARNKLTFTRPTVCIVNGDQGLLKENYSKAIGNFESIVFVTLPEGGDGGSNPLQIIATIALVAFAPAMAGYLVPGGAAAAAGSATAIAYGLTQAAIMIGGMALIGALIPPPKPPSTQAMASTQGSTVYSLQAQGNVARLGSAIPEIFGTHRIYPDFAATPYTEYNGNEQYLYQLFAIGVGEYTINDVKIEDTAIANFEEVDYEIYEPGDNVTLFPTNVETSSEVSGQELLQSQYVGPFTANASGTDVNYLAVDIVFPKGLFYANDEGGLDGVNVSVLFEYREIDDSGTPIGSWTTLVNTTVGDANATPIRRTYRTSVTLGRYEVRGTRTSTKQTSSRYGNDVTWTALKAYNPGVTSYDNATTLAVRMRATNNLSSTSSKRINVSVTRKLNTWNSTTGWSASKVGTSAPAWILAYICKEIVGESHFSLLSLEALQTELDTRNSGFTYNDEFNGVIDNQITFWEALQLICKSVRAFPVIQGGSIYFIRDKAQTVPTALFSMRNIVKGTFSSTYILPSEDTADALEVEYWDANTLKPKTVMCELDVGNSTNVANIKLFGVTTRDHAYREGMYHVTASKYRRIITSFTTELEGHIPTIGDLVAVAHDMPDWGQSGEIIAYETYATNYWKLTLSEPVTEGTGQHYIILRDKDGSPTTAIEATVDATDKTILTVLKADVTITINVGHDYERTHYAFGIATEFYQVCRVIPPIKPKGTNLIELNVVNEEASVHTADGGSVPSEDEVFDLPAPIVKPVIASLNVTTGGTPDKPILGLSWTPAVEADSYIIEWGLNNLEWTRAGETVSNNYSLVVPAGLIYVRVAGVGLVTGDWISTSIDARLLPIPGLVQDLALAETFTGTQATIEWSGAARAHSYKIEVYADSTLRRTVTTALLTYTYRSEDAVKDGGPWRALTFKVYGINDSGQSESSADLAVSNSSPSVLTGVGIYTGYKSIIIDYDAVADTDFAGVRVCMAETTGFTPGDGNVVYEGKDRIITIPDLIVGTIYYLRLAAYDEFGKDSLTYTAEYSATISLIPDLPEDILDMLNEELAETDSDALILDTTKFAVRVDGSEEFPLIIANVGGTNYVGISADTIIEGTLSASQITTGELAATESISLGNGAVTIDGDGAIVIYDGDDTESNRDYAILTDGDLVFQRYNSNTSSYEEYKSVKKVVYGTADSGDTVTLPGYWKSQPKIIVSPNQIESYDKDTGGQSQAWQIRADSLAETSVGSGIYEFDAVAELILSSSIGNVNHNDSSTRSDDNTWTTSTYTWPENTASAIITVNVSSKKGTGATTNIWYYRKVSWRVVYTDKTTTTEYQTAWQEVEPGANIDNIIEDDIEITPPTSNSFDYKVEFKAANLTSDPTFTSGSINYEYDTDVTGLVSSTYDLDTGAIGTNSPKNVTVTLPTYSTPSGWSIYQVKYEWRWGNSNMGVRANGTVSGNALKLTDPNGTKYFTTSSLLCSDSSSAFPLEHVYSYRLANHSTVSKTVSSTLYNRYYIYANNVQQLQDRAHDSYSTCSLGGATADDVRIAVYQAKATIYLKKPTVNSITPVNFYELSSIDWTLSSSSALSTGSLNYMAIEG